MSVRVRIGPSPTGIPHIGVTRTALFNYLFAKKSKGKFIVRIEDTDRARLVPESVDKILEILKFLNLNWDEGPILQSGRLAIYQEHAKKLVENDAAYYCFCTPDRLEKIRDELQKKGKPAKYDRHCLALSKEEINKKIVAGEKHVIRLKVPEGKTSWNDLIHGTIEFKNEVLDDSVLLKSDGFPTYHLAVVVDDHLMKISHVLRGDEWISSTPKHLILYDYFDWPRPEFAHLPVVLGSDKAKLSKRHGVKSVLEYRDEGCLPEALINFMALLGWSPKTDQEIFSLAELIEKFDLKGINPTSPIFNLAKLNWFNQKWIQKLSNEELVERLDNFIPKDWDREKVLKILPLVKERITVSKDFVSWADFFFSDVAVDKNLLKNSKITDIKNVLEAVSQSFSREDVWIHTEIEREIRSLAKELNLKDSELFMLIRVAISGKTVTPPLFESLEVLGKEKTLQRIKNAKGQI